MRQGVPLSPLGTLAVGYIAAAQKAARDHTAQEMRTVATAHGVPPDVKYDVEVHDGQLVLVFDDSQDPPDLD